MLKPLSLSLFPLGSLLMSVPSSVETSTSTGSGDWLNPTGRGLLPLPLCRLPSYPPFPRRRPTQSSLSFSRVLRRRGLRWPPITGCSVWDHPCPETTGERGGASLFIFSLILYLYFFPKQMEPLCLIAPDTDCEYEVGLCLLSSVVLF